MDNFLKEKFNWGFHYLKTLCLFVLCLTHAYSWSSEKQQIPIGLTNFYQLQPLIDTFASFFQTLAGVTFCAALYSGTGNNQNESVYKNVFKIGAILVCLETIKYGLTYGWNNIIHWGSLNTIALAMIVITFLSKYSIRAVFISMIATSVFLPEIRSLFHIQPITKAELMLGIGYPSIMNYIFSALSTAVYISLFLILQKSKIEQKYKKRGLGILTILFSLLLYQSATYVCNELGIILAAKTYFSGGLVGDYDGVQLFPFFVWYPKICLGFLFYYFIQNMKIERPNLLWLLRVVALGAILTVVFFDYHGSNAAQVMFEKRKNIHDLWGGGIVNDDFQNQTLLLAAITLILGSGFFGLIEIYFDKMNRVISKVSRASLWIYLFVTGPGFHIIEKINYYLNFKEAIFVSMVTLVLMSLVIAELVHLIGQKKLLFVVKKRQVDLRE